MSRDGFRVADHDPRFLHDVKVRRLRREAGDDGEGAIRTLLYLALRDSSWADGERLAIEDADTPYEATPERVAALQSVGLIDDDGRIPARSWEGWFRPAWDRREKMRSAGRETNRKRWGQASPPVSPSDSPSDSPSVSPSVPIPSDTVPSGDARATVDDPFADPEHEALVWLARHGCDVRPGNGYHRHLVTMVESYGVAAVLGMFDRLATAGMKPGDVKGYVFGARDALDAPSRPKLAELARNDRADEEQRAHRARLAATRRLLDEYQSPGSDA